jgi:hypothetical protein
VPHPLARRSGEPGDVADDGLRHRLRDERRGALLVVAADLADHHDEVGLRIGLEPLERVDEADPVDRVATHTDARRLPDPPLAELVHDLVRQRSRPRDEADAARRANLARDDPDVRAAGRDRAGTVRPDQRRRLAAEVGRHAGHVPDRDPFGDADDQAEVRVDALVDRLDREPRRHEDRGRVRAGGLHRVRDRVEHRDPLHILPPLARRDAGDDVRSVGAIAERVEGTLAAGDSAHDDPGVAIDEDAHPVAAAWARAAASAAASSIVDADTIAG